MVSTHSDTQGHDPFGAFVEAGVARMLLGQVLKRAGRIDVRTNASRSPPDTGCGIGM